MKTVYIVLTQTGTLVSKCLKAITGKPYNHSSISLDISLNDIATLFVGTTNKDANYIASMLPPKFSKILASNSQRQHDDLSKENFAGAQHYHE